MNISIAPWQIFWKYNQVMQYGVTTVWMTSTTDVVLGLIGKKRR